MESTIKWQTGEPTDIGFYLITTEGGHVTVNMYREQVDGKRFWMGGIIPIAWHKISDIQPYKKR